MTEQPQSFEEFWPYYVSQHQNAWNRRLHFTGTTLAGACLAATPFVGWPALVAAPVVGYGLAWVGHFGFEKNRPATWGGAKAAVWSLRGDLKMWKHMAMRTMDAELAKYAEAPATNGVTATEQFATA